MRSSFFRFSFPRRPSSSVRRSRGVAERAFTLIELLTVIAIIGILSAILIPSVSSARKSANRAKTKVQFNQWAAAIESFRAEYGYYPNFADSTHRVNGPGDSRNVSGEHLFHDILAGKKRDASSLGSAAAAQNRRRIAFYTFGESDLSAPDSASPYWVQDAFGNTSIAVLVDKNLDGAINVADYAEWPTVLSSLGDTLRPSAEIPATGIRVGVAFYCADPDATAANPRFLVSWK